MQTIQYDFSDFNCPVQHGAERQRARGATPSPRVLHRRRARQLAALDPDSHEAAFQAAHNIAVAVLRLAWEDAESGDDTARRWLCGGRAEIGLWFWCSLISTHRDRSYARLDRRWHARVDAGPFAGDRIPLDPDIVSAVALRRWPVAGGVQ